MCARIEQNAAAPSRLFRPAVILLALVAGGCTERDPARISWTGQADVPAFPGLINGMPTPILIDSGFDGTLEMPLAVLGRFHLTPAVDGGGEAVGASGIAVPWRRVGALKVMVGTTEANVKRAQAQPQGRLPMVGMEFLLAVAAIIDCSREAIFTGQGVAGTTWEAEFTREHLLSVGYQAIPLLASPNDQLLALGTLAGHPVTFSIDTGAQQTSLDQALLAQWGLVDDHLWTKFTTFHFLRDHSGRLERQGASVPLTLTIGAMPVSRAFDLLDLGPLNLARTRIHGAAGVGSQPIAGIIGMDEMLALRAIIDLRAATLYLLPLR